MTRYIQAVMPFDGSRWLIPLATIAAHRARDPEYDARHEATEAELLAWADTRMSWTDVRASAEYRDQDRVGVANDEGWATSAKIIVAR